MDPWRMTNHRFLDSGSTTQPQHSGHLKPWGSPSGTPQWRNARSRPRNFGVAEGGLERRDPTLVGGGARSQFTLSTLVQVAGKDDSAQLHAEVADEQQ